MSPPRWFENETPWPWYNRTMTPYNQDEPAHPDPVGRGWEEPPDLFERWWLPPLGWLTCAFVLGYDCAARDVPDAYRAVVAVLATLALVYWSRLVLGPCRRDWKRRNR